MSFPSKQQILEILSDSKLELSEIFFSDQIIERFQQFCSLLAKWNEKINLISEKTALSILEKHIFDSLQYLRWVDSSHKALDIGSGAGFPGIPIKIIHPEIDLTLLDSQRKRCNFLREVTRSLKLEKIRILEGRAESFFDQELFSNRFDRVFFRGFSSIENCLAVGLPFLKTGGQIILKKDPEELPESALPTFTNARIIESKTVEGFEGQSSMMMVIEKCST